MPNLPRVRCRSAKVSQRNFTCICYSWSLKPTIYSSKVASLLLSYYCILEGSADVEDTTKIVDFCRPTSVFVINLPYLHTPYGSPKASDTVSQS